MNRKLIFFIFSIVLSTIYSNLLGQSIYETAVKKAGSERAQYDKYQLATSNAYGYLQKDYNPKVYNKIAIFVNTEDHKTIKFIKDRFEKYGIQAIPFFELACDDCTDADHVKLFLSAQGIECLLQITLTSEIDRGVSISTSYFSTHGSAVSSGTMSGWSDVCGVL